MGRFCMLPLTGRVVVKVSKAKGDNHCSLVTPLARAVIAIRLGHQVAGTFLRRATCHHSSHDFGIFIHHTE